jgi:hypothetical protein
MKKEEAVGGAITNSTKGGAPEGVTKIITRGAPVPAGPGF